LKHRSIVPTLAFCLTLVPSLAGAQAAPRKAGQPAPSRASASGSEPAPPPAAPAAKAAPPAPKETPQRSESEKTRTDQARGERAHVGFNVALAAPMSSLGRAFSAGYNAGVFVQGHPATLPVSLRGDLNYARFAGKNELVTPSYSIAQATGAAVYDFKSSNGGAAPFFATMGLGLYRTTAAGATQTDFGQNLGAGFRFRQAWGKPVVEGRFHFFNDVEYFALSLGFRR
jgi:hypothetical protein